MNQTSCPLTAFITLAFVCVGFLAVTTIVGLALWMPIEIQQNGEIIKGRNSLYFKINNLNK